MIEKIFKKLLTHNDFFIVKSKINLKQTTVECNMLAVNKFIAF